MGRSAEVIVNKALLVVGLLAAVTAAGLLVLNVIGSGFAVALGILGIGLVAVSGRGRPARS